MKYATDDENKRVMLPSSEKGLRVQLRFSSEYSQEVQVRLGWRCCLRALDIKCCRRFSEPDIFCTI